MFETKTLLSMIYSQFVKQELEYAVHVNVTIVVYVCHDNRKMFVMICIVRLCSYDIPS